MDKFFFKNEFINLGNWKDNINFFDPFLDNKSQSRIGNFLNSLLDGFNQGLDREHNINKAIIKYRIECGDDKIILDS